MPENTEKLESLNYRSPKSSPEAKEKTTPVFSPVTGPEKDEIAGQPFGPIKCGVAVPNKNSKTKGEINKNLMIIQQVDGACKVALELLAQITPKTSDAEDCIITLKAWQNNNLKHLKGAFE